MTLAVGWPGQWEATFQGTADGARIQAGQEIVSLNLLPGECIRTPRITLMAWEGNETRASKHRAINLWRRWYLTHVLPRPDGQPLRPRLAVCGPEEGEEFTAATEENQLENIGKFARHGIDFDVWWIDAGWYPCYDEQRERKWWITGSWEPDPERFPNGLKSVSEQAEKHGADLLVWFEPERVRPGTRLDRERPEWLLKSDEDTAGNRLLYLGNPEARAWLTEHVCRLIQENGIKIYRQDFNFEPLSHWREGDRRDTKDDLARQGFHENQHVQGYLQYWDDLLERNPGLWINFLLQRRQAQRSGDHAQVGAAALHRLWLRYPPGQTGFPPHPVRMDPIFQRGDAVLGHCRYRRDSTPRSTAFPSTAGWRRCCSPRSTSARMTMITRWHKS